AARSDPRGHQGRRIRRGPVHLVLDRAEPDRDRREAARGHGHRGDRAGDGEDRCGVRAPGGRHGAPAIGHRPGGRAGRARRRAARRGRRRRRARAQAQRAPPRSPQTHSLGRLRNSPQPWERPGERGPEGRRRRRNAGERDRKVAAGVGTPASGDRKVAAGVGKECARPMTAGFPVARPRRLRRTAAIRRLVAPAGVRPANLVLPLFVKEGTPEPQPVASMPGVGQHTRDSLRKAAAEAVDAGVGGLILFGIPAVKDARGSAADDPDGIIQVALRDLDAEVGRDTVLIADLCLCEYTDHGHCGTLTPSADVDNDATLERYASIAVAQAAAGAHVVAPSGMMDGQVAAIRTALDRVGFSEVAICSYSAKYASAFYGPFRDAAEGAPQFGDRASYQQDLPSADEALREVLLDADEGADI